ncbi:hypothetical protein C7402_107225 [Paraburkholderia unamae]|uniref:Uncharacterized protein n=1 Tax=Paraburkholderia unamae TaxID=219649 RepID=A0ABX5KN12_9BURK|nr:hypothetical protein C7402_107225 [Paraburkholderia unamae]
MPDAGTRNADDALRAHTPRGARTMIKQQANLHGRPPNHARHDQSP